MRAQLVVVIALVLGQCASGIPSLLECANDTTTRMSLGRKAIMAGPVLACPLQCPVKVSTKPMGNGNMQIVVTTSGDGIGFNVRVNDGLGKLSSTNVNMSSTCDGQMHSVGSLGVPAGTYVLVLTPAPAIPADLVVTVGFAKSFAPGVTLVQDPPLPPAKVYRCEKNVCTEASTGVGLDVCKQICAGERKHRWSPVV